VLAAGYLLAVVVLALSVPLGLNLERRATSEFQSGVLGNAAILAAQVSHLVAAVDVANPATLDGPLGPVVRDQAQRTGARIVLTQGGGLVVADTAGEAMLGELYATPQRPEFGVALFGGRIDSRRRLSETAGEELLLVTVPLVQNGQVVGAVRMSRPLAAVTREVRRRWAGLALIGTAVVVAGLALAWFLATSLARPVSRLEDTASRLGGGDLGARADPRGPGELGSLARSFNQMADTLSANLTAQQDFLANASHQLRTPLAGIKLRLEAIQRGRGSPAEEAGKAEHEVDRLGELVEDLLQLARASSEEPTGHWVDLGAASRQAVDRWAGPVADAGKRIRLEVPGPRPVSVWANPTDLANVLDNLIENAVRYSPPDTEIVVEGAERGGRPTLSVSDDGPGIPPEERTRVFERFYRGSTGRRAGSGTGLGLALVAELVERWGGQVRLGSGPGTRIEATFPSTSTPPVASPEEPTVP
jgi:two-component system, OmpR family, sensor kinase